MNFKNGLGWKIYFLVFAFLATNNLLDILNCQSAIYSYYHVLMIFHENYFFHYFLNVVSAFFTFLSILPLFLFAFQIRFLRPSFWRYFFSLRVAFDICGHGYETQFIKSLFYANTWHGISALIFLMVIILPSYFALSTYAFRQNLLSLK